MESFHDRGATLCNREGQFRTDADSDLVQPMATGLTGLPAAPTTGNGAHMNKLS